MSITVRTVANVAEVATALGSDRGARFFAGGSLIMRAINEGDLSISTIVRTSDNAVRDIRSTGQQITLGAGVTMAGILADRELAFLHPAAQAVGGPAVRNQATVGGNLFAASPYGDFATALLALDATVSIHSGFGNREMPLQELLAGRDRETGLFVASISFGRPAGAGFRFLKVSRVKPKRLSVLSIAALLPLSGGRVQSARIAYGAMASTPIRIAAVERALEGQNLDTNGIAKAIAVASEGCTPSDDAIASAWYRREVAPVHLRRLLLGLRD